MHIDGAYFVLHPDFWSDLPAMARFDTAVNSSDFEKAEHFNLTGDPNTQGGTRGIDIPRPTWPIITKPARKEPRP
jgi:hypothetical protein